MQNQEAHRCAGVKAKEPVCTIRRLVTYRGTEKGSTRLSTMRVGFSLLERQIQHGKGGRLAIRLVLETSV